MGTIDRENIKYVQKLIEDNDNNEYCDNVQNDKIYKSVIHQLKIILYDYDDEQNIYI